MAAKKKRPVRKAGVLIPTTKAEPVYDMVYLANEMAQVIKLLEQLIERIGPPRRQTLDELDPPVQREYMAGGFKRRSGDIYQSVAKPGTPNAGAADADDPSGPV